MSHTKARAIFWKAYALLVTASIVIGLNSDENWRLRGISAALLLAGCLSMFVSFIFSRTFVFIGPRLVESSLKVRLAVEVICRVCILGMAIYLAPTLFYMCLDFGDVIKRGSPISTEALVTYVPRGAMWDWAWKQIGLQTADGNSARYNLFFHPRYPSLGRQYKVVLFPKSKCVLSLRQVQ